MFSSLVWGDINCCALCVLDLVTRVAFRQACWCVLAVLGSVFLKSMLSVQGFDIFPALRIFPHTHTYEIDVLGIGSILHPPRCSRTDNHERQRSSDLQSFKLAATQWDLLRFSFSWHKHLAPCQVKQRVLLHQGSLFEMESEWPQAAWCGYLLECPRLPVGDALGTPPGFFSTTFYLMGLAAFTNHPGN